MEGDRREEERPSLGSKPSARVPWKMQAWSCGHHEVDSGQTRAFALLGCVPRPPQGSKHVRWARVLIGAETPLQNCLSCTLNLAPCMVPSARPTHSRLPTVSAEPNCPSNPLIQCCFMWPQFTQVNKGNLVKMQMLIQYTQDADPG